MDYARKWNKYRVGLSKLSHMPHELQGMFWEGFFLLLPNNGQIVDDNEWSKEGPVGGLQSRKASAGRRILIKPSPRAEGDQEKNNFSFTYKAAPGYSSGSVSRTLIAYMQPENHVKMQVPSRQSHWCRDYSSHSEAQSLNAPEVHRDSPLRTSGSCPDSQTTPACWGLGSLEMIVLEPISYLLQPAIDRALWSCQNKSNI